MDLRWCGREEEITHGHATLYSSFDRGRHINPQLGFSLISMPIISVTGAKPRKSPSQCQRPRGWFGRFVLWSMNRRHSKLTDWGLEHAPIHDRHTILDVGCGGGRTVAKLAAAASGGKVFGIDHAQESVDAARRTNRELIGTGRVDIQQASVSDLPFANDTFDLVTAVETHFWWQDLPAGLREIYRVLRAGGRMLLIAEFYNGGRHAKYADRLAHFSGMASLTLRQHEQIISEAGFAQIQLTEEHDKGWMCAVGVKPLPSRTNTDTSFTSR